MVRPGLSVENAGTATLYRRCIQSSKSEMKSVDSVGVSQSVVVYVWCKMFSDPVFG